MATFTVLISMPDADAPTLPVALAMQIKEALETGANGHKPITSAIVDATVGDALAREYKNGLGRHWMSELHQAVWPEYYRFHSTCKVQP